MRTVDLTHGWKLWSQFELRGTGFPLSRLDPLHAAGLTEQIDALGAAQSQVQQHRDATLKLLKEMRQNGHAEAQQLADQVRKREPGITSEDGALNALLRALEDARNQVDAL